MQHTPPSQLTNQFVTIATNHSLFGEGIHCAVTLAALKYLCLYHRVKGFFNLKSSQMS